MKKILLTVASWSLLMLGMVAFTSCGKDDEADTSVSLVDKYSGKDGVTLDGNDVVYSKYGTVTVYKFSSDEKLESVTTYIKYATNDLAKTIYNNFKNEEGAKENLKLDGNVISYTERIDDVEGLDKGQLLDYLKNSGSALN